MTHFGFGVMIIWVRPPGGVLRSVLRDVADHFQTNWPDGSLNQAGGFGSIGAFDASVPDVLVTEVVQSSSEDTTGESARYDKALLQVRVGAQPINLEAAERVVKVAWAIMLNTRGTPELPSVTGNRHIDVSAL